MPRRFLTSPLGSLSIPGPLYSAHILQVGYHTPTPAGPSRADGSITLISGGPLTVLVDTGGPWLRDRLPGLLKTHGVTPSDITHVVATHGHSDHVGNLNLFPQATLLVGFDLSHGEGIYSPNGLAQGVPLVLHPGHLEVAPTPGHTRAHVSLVATGTSEGTVVVAGDVFERRGDEREWRALSEEPGEQRKSRRRVLAMADVIVPGHGEPFRVERESGRRGQEEEEEEEGSGREEEDEGGWDRVMDYLELPVNDGLKMPEREEGWDRDMDYLELPMNDGGERARKASSAAWLQEDFQPLEPPAGGAIVWRKEAVASPNNLAFLLILIHVFDKLCLLKMAPP
ncbi:Metallo-beta-lactamase domain-containing protein 1 [Turdus rufiventris]|nr:Metallo-beta-lactamase domain-containing protein 1 [Turdus rufiventris]